MTSSQCPLRPRNTAHKCSFNWFANRATGSNSREVGSRFAQHEKCLSNTVFACLAISSIASLREIVCDSLWMRNPQSGAEQYTAGPAPASLSQKSQSAEYHKDSSRPPTAKAASRRNTGAGVAMKSWTKSLSTIRDDGISFVVGNGQCINPKSLPFLLMKREACMNSTASGMTLSNRFTTLRRPGNHTSS